MTVLWPSVSDMMYSHTAWLRYGWQDIHGLSNYGFKPRVRVRMHKEVTHGWITTRIMPSQELFDAICDGYWRKK